MYKLLIADDEILERQALRYFIENSKLEIEEILECGNGVDAVKLALTEQPDICILDIKMAGLNGLEAMERIKTVNRHCKVIFSTAYNYFEYAVEALRLGAMDYMLKPVKKELLFQVLNKAIDELDSEESMKAQTHRSIAMSYMMEKMAIKGLISGQIDTEVLWLLEDRGISTESMCISFFWRLGNKLGEAEKKELATQLRDEISPMGIKYMLAVHKDSIDLLLFGNSTLKKDYLEATITKVFNNIIEKNEITARAGCGSWCDNVYLLSESYARARKELNETTVTNDVSSNEINTASTLADLPSDANKVSKSVPTEIKAMCDYMEKNFDQKIFLEDITGHVGFSKYYGSRLFKQHIGMTVMDYLIGFRINKAKELLKQGDYSIKQISSLVGYQDPNYFTWAFKKGTGMSPAKYRYYESSK